MELTLETGEKEKQPPDHTNVLSRLTVEHAIYALIATVAFVLRAAGLSNIPLSPAEASEALAVWDLWQPGANAAPASSPAYFGLTSPVTQLVGFSDTIMRIVPTLSGVALVLLPWFLRHRNGRLGSIVTSCLLAIAPTYVLASRTAGGQSLALTAGMLLFVSWLRYQETGDRRWFFVLSLALGLGLSTSPLFYGIIVTIALAWFAQGTLGPPLFVDEKGKTRVLNWPDQLTLRRAALMAFALFFAASTAVLLKLEGLGASARLLTDWLALFVSEANVQEWLTPLLALPRYEPILLLFGTVAVVWAFRRGRPYPILLVYWLLAAWFLMLLQRGNVENILLIALPGYLLVGRSVNDVLQVDTRWYKWPLVAAIIISGTVAYVHLASYSRASAFAGSSSFFALMALTTVAFAVTLIVFVWSWNRAVAVQGVVAGLMFLLVVYTWGTSWWVSKHAANDTREGWVSSASDNDLSLLASTIKEISWQTTNSANELHLLATFDSPSLRWYLRDFPNLQFGSASLLSSSTPAIITPMEHNLSLEDDYLGTDFGHTRPNTPHMLSPGETLRWLLFHESPVPINEERVILWLRADLVEGSE